MRYTQAMEPKAQNRNAFGTLTLVAIIIAVLLVTGIGQLIWRNAAQIGTHCRDMMLSINFNAGLDVCDSLGHSVVSFQRYLERQVGASSFGDSMNLEEFSGYLARQFTSTTLGFNAPQLSGLINPQLLQSSNFGSASPLSLSLTHGAYGSNLLSSGNTSQGLQYLQSSAQMGDVGILSQLQLGSAYASGSNGLAANPALASHYYQQALQSLQSLQGSNSQTSQQLLSALPASPQTMQMQLQTILQQR